MADPDGDRPETLAFSPDDGLLYHLSGQAFETVDPVTLDVTPIPRTGDSIGEATALVYRGGGVFLVTELNGEISELDTGGAATNVGDLDERLKGLAFVP